MYKQNNLRLLFATNFTDACFRAIRAIAQMADTLPISLTIAHVTAQKERLNTELRSFFAEADHYPICDRVQLHGSAALALSDYARAGQYDLVLAPRSDRLGFPRPFHRSTRAALLRTGSSLLWTGSRGLDRADFLCPYRVIAVGLDGSEDDLTHLNLAATFAAQIGARLHLLTVVPPIHEGSLLQQATSTEPLSEEMAIMRIESLLTGWEQIPTIDVSIGDPDRNLPRMLKRCEADLLFLPESLSRGGVFLQQISNTIDHSPCSVISVPTKLRKCFQWSFDTKGNEDTLYGQKRKRKSPQLAGEFRLAMESN